MIDLDGVLERIENGFIEQALRRSHGNKTVAAGLLNLNRTTFIERLRKKGMLQSSRRHSPVGESVGKLTDPGFTLTEALPYAWETDGYTPGDGDKIGALSF